MTSNLVTTGLVFDLDAGTASSYPGTGSAWNDLSGNGFNATLVGSPTYSSNALVFNGTSQYVTLPNLGMSPSGARTISAWVKPSSITGRMILFMYGSNTGDALKSFFFLINVVNSGDIYVGFNNADLRTAGSLINTSAYWNVCASYLGGALSLSNIAIYINGSSSSLTTAGAYIGSTPNTTNANYTIARSSTDSTAFYSGSIGRMSLYNVGLSSTQVMQNFNADKARFGL